MTDFMSIEQVVNAAKNDIDRQIENGTFKGYESAGDNEENFYTITSLYAQWARNENEAELALDKMYEEDYPEFTDLVKS